MAKIAVVDELDNLIGYKEQKQLSPNDIYRVSALWVTNDKGEVLMAKRAKTKSHDPGKWGPAVAGTVEEGEDYYSNIIKEAEEELGLKNIKPVEGPKIKVGGEHKYFGQWYMLTVNKDISEFKIQKKEVDEVQWFPVDELRDKIENRPEKFLNSMLQRLNLFSHKK